MVHILNGILLRHKNEHIWVSFDEVDEPITYCTESHKLERKIQYSNSCEELTHWKRLWCWERLKAGGERDDRGWDCWMASLTQWTWVWVNSRSWWWTGRPGVLWSMGLQRVGHDWATELNWTESLCIHYKDQDYVLCNFLAWVFNLRYLLCPWAAHLTSLCFTLLTCDT